MRDECTAGARTEASREAKPIEGRVNMNAMNRRRGRPRGARASGPDLGTPEAQRKRLELVGEAPPELAEYPLGVLLARGTIARDEHDAGCHYAYLRGKALGNTTVFGMFRLLFPSGGGRALDGDVQATVEARWRAAAAALLAAGRPAKDAVDNAAIYLRLPRWLKPTVGDGGGGPRPRPGDRGERQALVSGLRALAAHFRLDAGRLARSAAGPTLQMRAERYASQATARVEPPAERDRPTHGSDFEPDHDTDHRLIRA